MTLQKDGTKQFDFNASPTVRQAVLNDVFVSGIRGPVGSGKSVGGVGFLLKGGFGQVPDSNNIRRSRWAVIRNTTPELKSTTIKTVEEQLPPGPHGSVVYSSPITYHLRRAPEGGKAGYDIEILFLGLDRPADVKKLLSLELTGAWVNEAREVPKTIIDGLTERVGRYPPFEEVPDGIAPCIYMDTNSMDGDHWWPEAFGGSGEKKVVTLPDGTEVNITWAEHVQPPAVLEVEELDGGGFISVEPGYTGLRFTDGEVVASAGKFWGVNPAAENLPNLRPGYYHQQIENKTLEHIQCYQQNKLVYVREGKPVIPNYVPSLHGGRWPILDGVPLIVGIDAGGGTLQPAAVVIQRHPRGPWIAQSEVIGESMGMETFVPLLKQHLAETYPNHDIGAVWMDPAGEGKDEIYETKVSDYFRAAGFPVRAAPTQDPATRIDAVNAPCARLIDGKPGLMVNTERCPMLHKALAGAWYMRRLQVAGVEKYVDKPEKNHPYSDLGDALGYGLCGGGEARVAKTKPRHSGRQAATIEFDVF